MRYCELDEKYEQDQYFIDMPLNISPYTGDAVFNLLSIVQEMIQAGQKPIVVKMKPSALLATDDFIDPSGFCDGGAVFKQYHDKPVILNFKKGYHILDGHKMVCEANRKHLPVDVYLFTA